jgi:hypothetical protein
MNEEVVCPCCKEPCPIERLDSHVEIIDCCNRKWVVRVDGKLAKRFEDETNTTT